MRDIKFRAWDLMRMTTSGIMFNSTTSMLEIPNGSGMVLMQYTGLKDKNGKEIYEGDIVKLWECFDEDEPELNEFELSEVKYCAEESDYPAFEIKSNYFYESNILQAGVIEGRIEVIGNIYENPELLEEK